MPLGITWPGYEGGAMHFTGVPGIYGPGVVVPLASTGRTESEMRELLMGTPLEIVEMSPPQEADSPETEEEGED